MPRQLTSEPHVGGETADGLFVLSLSFVDYAVGCQLIKQLPDSHRVHVFAQLVDPAFDPSNLSFCTPGHQMTSRRLGQ